MFRSAPLALLALAVASASVSAQPVDSLADFADFQKDLLSLES